MSNYFAKTKHPVTRKWEQAEWLDGYFRKHEYSVRFKDGMVFRADDCKIKKNKT